MSLSNMSYFDDWEIIREELLMVMRTKDINKNELMRKGTHLLVSMLEDVTEAAPLNYIERIAFIESNIERHVAFVQLDELFKESKKKLASIRAQKKAIES